jgi:hypothetical protein
MKDLFGGQSTGIKNYSYDHGSFFPLQQIANGPNSTSTEDDWQRYEYGHDIDSGNESEKPTPPIVTAEYQNELILNERIWVEIRPVIEKSFLLSQAPVLSAQCITQGCVSECKILCKTCETQLCRDCAIKSHTRMHCHNIWETCENLGLKKFILPIKTPHICHAIGCAYINEGFNVNNIELFSLNGAFSRFFANTIASEVITLPSCTCHCQYLMSIGFFPGVKSCRIRFGFSLELMESLNKMNLYGSVTPYNYYCALKGEVYLSKLNDFEEQLPSLTSSTYTSLSNALGEYRIMQKTVKDFKNVLFKCGSDSVSYSSLNHGCFMCPRV